MMPNKNGKTKKAKAKQADLPGMEDRRLDDLDAAAREYAEHRDERMQAFKDEVELKRRVLNLMHRHKKNTYDCDGVTIDVVPTDERIRVRVEKPKNGAASEFQGE
jgi:hypothetical protein